MVTSGCPFCSCNNGIPPYWLTKPEGAIFETIITHVNVNDFGKFRNFLRLTHRIKGDSGGEEPGGGGDNNTFCYRRQK